MLEVKQYKNFEPFIEKKDNTHLLTDPSNDPTNVDTKINNCSHCPHCRHTVWDCPEVQRSFMLSLFLEKILRENRGKMNNEKIRQKYAERYALLRNYVNAMAQHNNDLTTLPARVPQCMIQGLYSAAIKKSMVEH